MRTSPTLSEARLWSALSGKKLGVAFRRQGVVGDSIVDFFAPARKLVVEVDGLYHTRRARADALRDARLQALGFRVLHLDADLVMHLPLALERIRSAFG